MASLLPDPRHWNLVVPAALLLASACGPGGASLDGEEGTGEEGTGEEVGDGDGDPTTGDGDGDGDGEPTTGDGDGDGDGECQNDSDCADGYYCTIGGYCEYENWCGKPHDPGREPGTVSNGPVHPACRPGYECYWQFDCGQGEICSANYCVPDPNYCGSTSVTEIPLLDPAGPILDLQFVDVDLDGKDELVLLTEEGIVVVDETLAKTSMGPVGTPALNQLTAARVDDDEFPDLVLTSQLMASEIWLNDGAGGAGNFSSTPSDLIGAVRHPVAVDWTPGGAQELAAHSPDGSVLSVFSGLGLPAITATTIGPVWDSADDIAAGPLEAGVDGVVSSEHCSVAYYREGAETVVTEVVSRSQTCAIALTELDGNDIAEAVTVSTEDGVSDLRIYFNYSSMAFDAGYTIPGSFEDLVALDRAGAGQNELVLWGPQANAYLVQFENGDFSCYGPFTKVPATRAVSGDLDGDGHDDLAIIDLEGQVRIYISP